MHYIILVIALERFYEIYNIFISRAKEIYTNPLNVSESTL